MIANYFKTAVRHLAKQRLFAAINILGLAIGLASAVLIFLFVRHESSYDRFHANADRLYRAYVTEDPPERDAFSYVEAPYPLAGALQESFPGVEETVRFHVRGVLVRAGDRTFSERCHLADPGFFRIFSFPLRRGAPETALDNPGAAIITESAARRFFGTADPLERTLSIKVGDRFLDFAVAGVAADPPTSSSVRFDLVIPFTHIREYIGERSFTQWLNVSYETYALLDRPLPAAEIDGRLAEIVRKHYPADYAAYVTLHLQPITAIHLDTRVPPGFEPTGDPAHSLVLSIIGLLILGVACVNFTTLAIGRSAGRAREVGVRKTMGAGRGGILRQFLGEAFLLTFAALLLGLILVEVLLPTFNALTGKALAFRLDPATAALLAALLLLVGLAAGSYPAFVLSRWEPADVMGRSPRMGGRGPFINGLVVAQFAASIGLIACAFVVGGQFRHLLGRDLGFDREQVLVIRNTGPGPDRAPTVERLRTELGGRPEVRGVAGASGTFARDWTLMGFQTDDGVFRQFAQNTTDYDYLRTLGISLVEGRDFSREFGADPVESLIVNQALLRLFGWETGVGRSLPGSDFPPHRIVGVVRDFNFQSLRDEIRPLVLALDTRTLERGISDINTSGNPRTLNFIHVRLAPGVTAAGLEAVRSAWERAAPSVPFEFSFLDQDIQSQYVEIARWRRVIGLASGFTAAIAALGLFGLTILTVAKRKKEIGIRKVLGASPGRIAVLFSTDFARLVVLANLAAWPVAFLVMRRWLGGFAYRIDMPYGAFILAAGLALAVALAAVAGQAVKAAATDPAETIRYE